MAEDDLNKAVRDLNEWLKKPAAPDTRERPAQGSPKAAVSESQDQIQSLDDVEVVRRLEEMEARLQATLVKILPSLEHAQADDAEVGAEEEKLELDRSGGAAVSLALNALSQLQSHINYPQTLSNDAKTSEALDDHSKHIDERISNLQPIIEKVSAGRKKEPEERKGGADLDVQYEAIKKEWTEMKSKLGTIILLAFSDVISDEMLKKLSYAKSGDQTYATLNTLGFSPQEVETISKAAISVDTTYFGDDVTADIKETTAADPKRLQLYKDLARDLIALQYKIARPPQVGQKSQKTFVPPPAPEERDPDIPVDPAAMAMLRSRLPPPGAATPPPLPEVSASKGAVPVSEPVSDAARIAQEELQKHIADQKKQAEDIRRLRELAAGPPRPRAERTTTTPPVSTGESERQAREAEFDEFFNDLAHRAASAQHEPTGPETLQTVPTRSRGRKALDAVGRGVAAVGAAGVAAAESVARGADKVQRGREALDEKGEQLKSSYRSKLEERARPGGDRIMGEQPIRGEALIAASHDPTSGWTDDDTQKYILALGVRSLAADAQRFWPFTWKTESPSRLFKRRQVLEMPKDLKDVFRRGNKIIMDYVDKKNAEDREAKRVRDQKKKSDEIETTLALEERARLQRLVTDGVLDQEQRALYLKIRSRKKPYPIPGKAGEWRVFRKVWGIADIVKKQRRSAMSTGAYKETVVFEKKPVAVTPEEGKRELTESERRYIMLQATKLTSAESISDTEMTTFFAMWARPGVDRGKPLTPDETVAARKINLILRNSSRA